MEILDASTLMSRAGSAGERARTVQLYPSGQAQGLLAVDLLEIEPGGSTTQMDQAEEQLLFVISGTGELRGGTGAVAAMLRANSVVHVGSREPHQLRNTGSGQLRVLVSTPLLVRSERALGVAPVSAPAVAETEAELAPVRQEPERARPSRVAERPAPIEPVVPANPAPQPQQAERDEAPLPDISALMKRGSDIAAGPRADRKKHQPEPELEPAVAQAEQDGAADEEEESEEAHRDLMELAVVFDGGSRGNPGQGYGSYLVQSPGRNPVIKRVEFGGNYTNNQAEYESLIACLQYIVERLTVTHRTPSQVALDIKSDSDLLVNQLQGNYKVKDTGLRQRHTRAVEMLDQFGEWMITWHSREESVRLLGH